MSPEFDSENFNSSPSSQPEIKLDAFTASPELGKLFEALSKAQAEMKPAVMDSKNPHFNSRYASLTACQEAYQAPLSKHGLALTQQIFSLDGRYFIRSVLGHSSGQWQAAVFELMIDRKNMQGLGSAITYARRYGINALVGVVDTEDDDAEGAMRPASGPQQRPASAQKTSPPPATQAPAQEKPPQPAALNAAQLSRIFAIAAERGWEQTQIRDYMSAKWKISSSKDLSREQYDSLIQTIETRTFQQACNGLIMHPGEGALNG